MSFDPQKKSSNDTATPEKPQSKDIKKKAKSLEEIEEELTSYQNDLTPEEIDEPIIEESEEPVPKETKSDPDLVKEDKHLVGNKFWDSETQKIKAWQFAKKRGWNYEDPQVRNMLREMYRQLEKKKKHKINSSTLSENLIPKIQAKLDKGEEITPEDFKGTAKINQTAATIFQHSSALNAGPLPPPTGYDSADGTAWDNPLDLENRKRVKYRMLDGQKVELPIFRDDIDWIEFFLGDPHTGGSLLRPKGKADFEALKKAKKLGRLYMIQREISRFLDTNHWSKFEVWRGAGKTVTALAKILRKICDNPNECFFLQSETDAKTVARIRTIKKELQTNQKIITYYGYLPADTDATGEKPLTLGKNYKGKWSEGILELKREYGGIEPTIMGISWQTGRGVGYHYTGGILDDPWSVKNQTTQGEFEKFWDWWGEFYGSLEDAKFCWVLCTRKGEKDIYTEMDERGLFASFKKQLVLHWPEKVKYIEKNGAWVDAIIEDKKPGVKYVEDDCFGKYTIEKCLIINKRIGRDVFEREYQNNPRKLKGNLFNWDKVNFCDVNATDPYARHPFMNSMNEMQGILIYDPAFGLSFDASLNALIAMAVHHRRIYILYMWIGHWKKEERVAIFNQARNLFPNYPLYCEDVMYQLNIIKDLTDSLDLHFRPFSPIGKGMKYKDLFAGQKDASKKAKIYDGLEPVVEDGRLFIMPKIPGLSEFEDEFKDFPTCSKLDVIDAVSMGCHILDSNRINTEVLSSTYYQRDSIIPEGTIGHQFSVGSPGNRENFF